MKVFWDFSDMTARLKLFTKFGPNARGTVLKHLSGPVPESLKNDDMVQQKTHPITVETKSPEPGLRPKPDLTGARESRSGMIAA
jgi:hypothetical protein